MLIIIQLTSLLITNRLLGSEGRGTFASATTWATLFFTLFFLSINTMYLKEFADQKADRKELANGFFTFGVLLSLGGLAIALLAYGAFNEAFIKLPFLIYVINVLTVPFMIIQSLSISVYQSTGEYRRLNIATLLTSLINLALILLSLLLVKFDVLVFSAISAFSWLCCGVYCFLTCRFRFSVPQMKKLFYRQFVSDLSYLHINTLMTFLVSSLNILIMHKYLSDEQVGQFFLASAVVGYLLILPMSIQNILITILMNKSNEDRVRTTGVFFKLSLLAMIVIVGILFFLANILVFVLGGHSFSDSGLYLQYLLPTVLFQVAGIFWSSLWTLKGYFKLIMKVSIGIVALSVICNFIFIRQWGVMGAILCANIITCLSMGVHLVLAIMEYRKIGRSAYEIIPRRSDLQIVRENVRMILARFRK